MTLFVTLMGVLFALTPAVAQLHGAGRYAEIGEEVRQSAWLALGLAAISIALITHPGPLLALSQLTPDVEAKTRAYLDTGIAGIAVSLGCGIVVGAAIFLAAGPIVGLYTGDAAVQQLAIGLLAFVAVYHVFDAVQAAAVQALRGYRRAAVPMAIYGFALWGLALGGGYAIGIAGVGVPAPLAASGFWLAAVAGMTLTAALVSAYFLRVSRAPSS